MTHFLATHWLHGSIVAIPVIAVIWALGPEIVARRRDRRSHAPLARSPKHRLTPPIVLVAVGTLGAAGVHASVIREHYGEAFLYGFFFTVAAVVQLAYTALVLTTPTRRLVTAGLVGNAAVVVLWAMTRFVAIPLGPASGSREAVGGRDLLATGFELLAVAAGVIALRALPGARPTHVVPGLPRQRSEPDESAASSNVRLVAKD